MTPFRLAAVALVGLLLSGFVPAAAAQVCDNTSVGLTPITELGSDTYLGYAGGLYPEGSNEVPADHLRLGMELAASVTPRNSAGEPDPAGLIGMISVGVSNTKIEFDAFLDLMAGSSDVNPRLVVLNGAQGSRALEAWAEGPNANPWQNVDRDLRRAGLAPEQVQVAWVKLPAQARGTPSLDDAEAELADLQTVLNILTDRFPNLRLAYLSSRIYAGYSAGGGEPKAYQNGFVVKWLIEEQIDGNPQINPDPAAGAVTSPWIAWGPYLWADGLNPREDGLTYECSDLDEDGIHPGHGAAAKVADLLFEHLAEHSTASSWFSAQPTTETSPPATGSPSETNSPPAATTTVAPPATSNAAPEPVQVSTPPPSERSAGLVVGIGALGVLVGLVAGVAYQRRLAG